MITPQTLVPTPIWLRTWEGLQAKSAGCRESACVWAGQRGNDREIVEEVYFLDEFPGVVGHRRLHITSREATRLLFETLRSAGQSIIADIHTHPTDWVDLSPTDAAHPIEYRVGLLALVLPSFALGLPDLTRTGVHIYFGEGKWKQLAVTEITQRIYIT